MHTAPLTGPFNREKALYKTKMKDGLIIIQALLLAVCVPAILLRKRRLVRKQTCGFPGCNVVSPGLPLENDVIELKIGIIQCQHKLKIRKK